MAHTATSEGFPTIAASTALQSALAGLDVSLEEELERYSTWRARGRMTTESVHRPPTRTVPRAEPTIDLPLRVANLTPPSAPAEEPTEPLVAPIASEPVAAPEPALEPAIEEVPPPPEEHPLAGFWTPAGIASFGLLAAASFTLGWFLLDPAGLGRFLQPSAPPPREGNLPQSLSEPVDPTVVVPVVRDPLPTGFVPLPGLGDRPGQSQTGFTRPSVTAPPVSVTGVKAAAPPPLQELNLPPVPTNAPPVEPARRLFGAEVAPAPVFPPEPQPVVTRSRRIPAPEPAVVLPPPQRVSAPEPAVVLPPPQRVSA
ncbi:MAG: hypothetical protein ACUVSQ_12815, partial [Pseudanabaenaceae cyanobacterium]